MSTLDGLDIMFGDEAELTPVQQPIPRPAPIVRPGEEPQRRAAPRKAPQRQKPVDGLDIMFGDDKPPQANVAPAQPAPQQAEPGPVPQPEPDAATWIGRRIQDVRGKRDPRFNDLPQFIDTEAGADLSNVLLAGKVFSGSDAAYSDIIASNLGDRLINRQKDANGYEVITYRGKDGQPISAYVNRPGLDLEDVNRAGFGAIPYLLTGGAAGALTKGLGIGAQTVAVGATAGGTSVENDMVAELLGSKQGVDPTRAAVTGVAGAAAVPLSAAAAALWRKLVTEPRYFNKGGLTPEGEALAREAGFDPAALTAEAQRQFAKDVAKIGELDLMAAKLMPPDREFGIPKTFGERTNAPDLLLREQRIRGGAYGESGAKEMQSFDTKQSQIIGDVVLGGGGTTASKRIPEMLAPGRVQQDMTKQSLGQSIRDTTVAARESVKATEREAWDKVRDVTAPQEALAELPRIINAKIGDFGIDETTTPAAAKMLKSLSDFISGKSPQKVADFLSNDPAGRVDLMRRRIGNMLSGATTGEDRAAARMIYQGYNDWIDEVAGSLVSANPGAAANLKAARAISFEVRQIFTGPQGDAGGRIMAQIMQKADSAENVINALFVGPNAQIKQGTATALKSLKRAYDTYLPPEQAISAWNDIRLAYWLRIAQNKTGEPVGVQQLISNVKRAIGEQGSITRELYTPDEINTLVRLTKTLDGIQNKNLNRSWSGVSAAGYAREMFNAAIGAFGFNSPLVRAAVGPILQPFQNVYGKELAKRSISQRLAPRPVSSFAAPGVAAGSGQILPDETR